MIAPFNVLKKTPLPAKRVLRIVAPSGAMESATVTAQAVVQLEKAGFEVQLDPQVQAIHQRFAGIDRVRAQAFTDAVMAPNVDIVMAARGGYGAHRLLPLLDWEQLAAAIVQQGKTVVGHSDFTAIELALLRHGAHSYAGPCAGVDFGTESVNAQMKKSFLAQMHQTINVAPFLAVKHKQPAAFSARGMLWGGNLAIICSLLGTPYFPTIEQISGGILFIEDVNERPFRIERMLNQLHQAGVLSVQSAVLWGDFGRPVPAEYDRGYGLPHVLAYLRDVLGVEVAAGLPFGHIAKKCTLPVGRQAHLDVTQTGWTCDLI